MPKKGKIVRYTLDEILKMKDKTDYKRLDAMTDDDIDYSDIPPMGSDFWKDFKPVKPSPKKMVSLRMDKDVLDWFRKQGKGYQGYMNAVLRAFVDAKQ